MPEAQYYIGVMSGSSLDGIDIALTDFSNQGCNIIATHFKPYPANIKQSLLALHEPADNELENAALISNQLALRYADAINELLNKQQIEAKQIKAIGCHGQTIRHLPLSQPKNSYTIQLGNHALLAELTNITVVGDFRSRDMAAGGQGAPLVPAFHLSTFASKEKNRAIINIGGIANITFISKSGEVSGFDSGPGNILSDYWAKLKQDQDYDQNGEWAATGVVLQSFLDSMLADPYFTLPPPKSTGRDLFNATWLNQHILYPHCKPEDIARTLLELTAHTITQALEQHCHAVDEVYLCGGGAHNQLLRDTLASKLDPIYLSTTDELAISVDWVEAVAFAWLAYQTTHQRPGNLPSATGAKGPRILGAIYPA